MTNEELNERARNEPGFNPRDYIVERDKASWQQDLDEFAASLGWEDYDMAELQDVTSNVSNLSGSGVDPAVYLNNAKQKIRERYTPSPGDDVLDGDEDADDDGPSGGGGGGGNPFPNPSANPYPRDGGAETTQRQLDEILAAIQSTNAQPDVDLSGIQPGDFPEFTVPGEDLSPAIDDTLLDIMENSDPFGIGGRLQDLLNRTQGGAVNSERLQGRLEGARENLSKGQAAALADLRGVLADRGLISEPGVPQGAELDATVRAFEPLQREYLSQVREVEFEESVRAEAAELDALERATGWSRQQVEQRLGAANTAQERQAMMADIALEQLNANMEWNMFLAEFGLKREQIAEDIRMGRVAAIQPLLSMFLALTAQSRGGYV